eukprot:CAMPEP_0195512014 /NCGR_PEP_ID=MMETSP0794_2-20130614/4132_1 /TAXON_ID=515487 /ORGANISM="Stephanopyxis turris, Strain CCMP 815" /LENGTH=1294 /DNA_ID=CAMNT_0040639729 /DNA_START=53 /DNA_END=3934 /DNA_ORIENTATION=+
MPISRRFLTVIACNTLLLFATVLTHNRVTAQSSSSGTKEFSFEDFEGNGQAKYCCSSGDLTDEVSNPNTSGSSINQSPHCGTYKRSENNQYDWLSYRTSSITDASTYTNGQSLFYMDIFTSTAPIGTEIQITLQDGTETSRGWPYGRHSRYTATTSTLNEWERLYFTFSYRPDPNILDVSITELIIQFAPNSLTSDLYYMDNLDSYVKDTTSPTMPIPTVSPTPQPIIRSKSSSEVIVIPDPPVPSDDDLRVVVRSDCPHWQQELLDWHDPSTWESGEVPLGEGEDVMIPLNSKVVVKRSIDGILGLVTIPTSSELILGEDINNQQIEINTTGMDVRGVLRAGSETCRLQSPLSITLHGMRPLDASTVPQAVTYKGIGVSGKLELHGKRYYRTWTRLARTVHPGDNKLLLQHSVNWEKGQEIVLVTTALKDSRDWHQNEVLIVESVDNDGFGGSVVKVTSGVVHTHIANMGYQAEVGLLSRSILINGAEADSEATDPDPGTCTTNRKNYGNYGTPCPNKELTGYGGHIIIYNGGLGYVEGVELYRMGQTNVLGRYPMHFHVLGDGCTGCYFRDSSIHHSFYRCISIHGTHNTLVSENVAYDVIGYCYYLEDGVEENNTISFNLSALIHFLGTAATGTAQTTSLAYQSPSLTLPADVTASGYYITNVHNNIIGNAASGGWAGFAFPVLHSPLGPHKNLNMRPSSRTALTIDGNTAHSSGWWWYHTGTFYSGGALYYDTDGTTLVYNAGRDTSRTRQPCLKDMCATGNCNGYCQPQDRAWIRMTNTKAFLSPSVGLNSWSGRMELLGYEAHDVGLSVESLESGFWIDDMLVVCRTGADWAMPPGSSATLAKGDGFFWYDTNQEHIITNSTFRNCGYRYSAFGDHYDHSPSRGCGNSVQNGCRSGSTVFGFLTHSDQFTPEIMQGTRLIHFQDCGRRFRLYNYRGDDDPTTVSGRGQNWIDVDGSVSGFKEPTIIGSGLEDAGLWWTVDDEVTHDPQGPLKFIKQNSGPFRGLGHIRFLWDDTLHNQVGNGKCGNGDGSPCPPLGYIKHFGPMFASDHGLPVTANPDIVGPVGGYGWLLKLNGGAPHTVRIELTEVLSTTPLVLGVAYPLGTSFTITAHAAYCSPSSYYTCKEIFHEVPSMSNVRESLGNAYHVDSNGMLTLRIIQSPKTYTGSPEWIMPDLNTIGKWGKGYAIGSFSRGGVTLPTMGYGPYLEIRANCPGGNDGVFCAAIPQDVSPQVCEDGYEQVAYDKCCQVGDSSVCVFPGGIEEISPTKTPAQSPTKTPTQSPTNTPTQSPT